jgi:branched-chain amino acid transport system substrate-binding protein
MTIRTTALTATALGAALLAAVLPASAQDKIKIGYAISKTGPNAGGANITQIPNYQLWVKEVNDKGGLMIGGKRVPIEVIEYDDRSNSEEAVRAVERLVTQDKVDLLFPPWGTGLNLAVGPVFNKYGYPQLAFSAVTDRAPELAKRWPNSFWLLGTSKQYVDGLVELLTKMRTDGKINANVAMISIADGFGIDLSKAAREGFEKAGFKLTYDKSYPVGTQDLSPLIGEASRSGADSFVAFSYPPDTMALTEQSRIAAFAPPPRPIARSTSPCTSATPTTGAARSATPRCRCWSRRSSGSARSTGRRSSRSCSPARSTPCWARSSWSTTRTRTPSG